MGFNTGRQDVLPVLLLWLSADTEVRLFCPQHGDLLSLAESEQKLNRGSSRLFPMFLNMGCRASVSYTHLTLPTNREV